MLQSTAVSCSVLQCGAVWRSVLQCVAVQPVRSSLVTILFIKQHTYKTQGPDVRLNAFLYVYMYICMHVCSYVCMYVCTFTSMYVGW